MILFDLDGEPDILITFISDDQFRGFMRWAEDHDMLDHFTWARYRTGKSQVLHISVDAHLGSYQHKAILDWFKDEGHKPSFEGAYLHPVGTLISKLIYLKGIQVQFQKDVIRERHLQVTGDPNNLPRMLELLALADKRQAEIMKAIGPVRLPPTAELFLNKGLFPDYQFATYGDILGWADEFAFDQTAVMKLHQALSNNLTMSWATIPLSLEELELIYGKGSGAAQVIEDSYRRFNELTNLIIHQNV